MFEFSDFASQLVSIRDAMFWILDIFRPQLGPLEIARPSPMIDISSF
jgi:hypothetical protein